MKFFVLFLIPINILLSQIPPPLPTKTKNYAIVESPPSLPLKRYSHVEVKNPPQLPSKRFSYVQNGHNDVPRVQSMIYHSVQSYKVGGRTFYECNEMTFHSSVEAQNYCQKLNNYELSKVKQKHWHHRSSNGYQRNSLSGSNSDLTHRRNSISRLSGSLRGRGHSFSGSRSSLSGLSKSSSRQSLADFKNHLSLRRNGVSGSNNALSSKRDSVFGSKYDLSSKINSVFGSTNNLLSRRNSVKESTGDLSERRTSSTSRKGSSLSRSRESLSNNQIGNEISEKSFGKNKKKKPESHEIWLKVWKDCTFKCFSARYYDAYKQKILLETNLYRLKHKANILQTNSQIADLAQDLAEQYLVKQKLNVKKYDNYGILYTRVKISLATTVLKDWYDTKIKYNFFLNKPSSEAANSFTQIVWRETRQLGVGVQRDDDYLVIVFVFYPKGNIKGEYGKNVHKWIS
uniref:SCP domain-containing protein n=1 Tax=Strongyloides papillosus TaxID=174720 RepID=A0A0N5B1X4_STREA